MLGEVFLFLGATDPMRQLNLQHSQGGSHTPVPKAEARPKNQIPKNYYQEQQFEQTIGKDLPRQTSR